MKIFPASFNGLTPCCQEQPLRSTSLLQFDATDTGAASTRWRLQLRITACGRSFELAEKAEVRLAEPRPSRHCAEGGWLRVKSGSVPRHVRKPNIRARNEAPWAETPWAVAADTGPYMFDYRGGR